MKATVGSGLHPLPQLRRLDTNSLIFQYDLAIASRGQRGVTRRGRRARTELITTLIVERAVAGDELADRWFRGEV